MTADAGTISAVAAFFVSNAGALFAFFRALDRRLTRIETIHEIAQDAGRCPFQHAHQAPPPLPANQRHH